MPGHPPLGELRILDFSRVLAGPFATMMLADLGAEVTKVERPGIGDETRSWGPPYDERGQATYFQSVNRNKRSIALDLASDEGRRRAQELARQADVVIENFRPGVMEKLGLGYERLSADNPRLVYCAITGFGAGRGAELPGYDLLVQALGGLMSITGAPEGEPQKVGVALVDVLSGLFACVGMLAALRHRDLTGEGQRVDVNLLSSLLAALVNQGSAYTIAGVVAGRMGNAHPSISPYELYETGAGELVVAVGNERQFAALCGVLGVPELASDPRFASNAARVAHREQLRAELVGRLAAAPAAEWAERLTAARVPAGQVNDLAGAFALAESLGLSPVVRVPAGSAADRAAGSEGPVVRMPAASEADRAAGSEAAAEGPAVALTRNPIGLSRTPPTYRSAPPPPPDG